MLKNMLKQIWNQRRSNGWLFAELLIVFTLLWYCLDILYNYAGAELQPKGYDIESTYHIELKNNPTQTFFTSNVDTLDRFWRKPLEEVLRRIRNYPEVESATMWFGTDAYTTNAMFQGYTTDSVHTALANIRYVSEDYCRVFCTEMLRGGQVEWNAQAMPLPAIVSRDLADSIFHCQDVLGQEFYDYYEPSLHYRIVGVMARQKNTDYERYEPCIITPMPHWFYGAGQSLANISVRVRPQSNTGFAERFTREMGAQLRVAPFYLFNVQSYREQKEISDADEGITAYVKSVRMVIVFFIVNVFLGLMGTFWFRARHRRSEIGLRLAMGSSRTGIRRQLIGEGLLLLTLASVPGILICANMVVANITFTESTDASLFRFITCILITWCLMALMVVAGIWFPARQAMKVQPAEALHEE